jgi:hypothetical protein
MHWAVVVLPPVVALAACAGVALYQQIQMMQQREREQQYWEPFRHAVPASVPAQPRCCPLQNELLQSCSYGVHLPEWHSCVGN